MARTLVAFFMTSLMFSILAARVVAQDEVPSGALYLATLPAGADVWLDGSYLGTSPLLVDGLAVGPHRVSVTKAGWSVKDVDVEVDDAQPTMENVRLDRISAKPLHATGTLAIHGFAKTWKAWVDGTPIGSASGAAAIVSAGSHALTVQAPWGKTTRRVVVYPDMTTNVVLQGNAEAH